MRLTAIKLAGFKSFVEPTTLVLDPRLTGIVGPNGCGKSNVSDAVRWVTGESSAKQLRGEVLVDVIFNGSRARKPVGRASVELLLDNEEGGVGGAYAGFSEIAIRRELARDGASSYAINGTRCRRRDVVDLFLGTGVVGRSNYAVIEQGAVNRLIEAKPEDLRNVLEEAAGISRYKERRRETENRLRHTRENMDRLNDLITEVSQRRARLQRQATNAEKYKQFKVEERRSRAELLALRWRELAREAESMHARLEEHEQATQEARSRVHDLAARRQAHSAEQQRAGREVQTRQARYYAAEGAVARVEQTLAHAREVEQMQRAEAENLARQVSELAARMGAEAGAAASLAGAIEAITRDLEAVTDEAARARVELEHAERLADDREAQWDALTDDQHNPLHQAQAARDQVTHIERDLTTARERLERLAVARAHIEKDVPRQALRQAEADVQRLAGELDRVGAQHEAAEGEVAQLRAASDVAETHLAGARQALADARGRLSALQALQQVALREDDDTLGEWLVDQGWSDALSAARTLRVAQGWEAAAEAALGAYLHAFCVRDFEQRTRAVGQWPGAGVTVLAGDGEECAVADSAAPGDTLCLATVLSGPPVLRALTRNVFLVNDAADARALLDRLAPGQMLVTRCGQCFGPGWLRVPGQDQATHGVLAREQAIGCLQDEVRQLGASEGDRGVDVESLRERLITAETRRRALAQEQDDLRRRHGERLAQAQGLRVQVDHAGRRRCELDGEIDDLDENRHQLEHDLDHARRSLQEAADASTAFVERRQTVQECLAAAREQRQRGRSAMEATREREQALRVDLAGQRSALQAAGKRSEQLSAEHRRSAQRLEALRSQAEHAAPPVADHVQAKTEAEQLRDAARAELETARAQLEDSDTQGAEIAHQTQSADHTAEQARDACQQARVVYETVCVRRQTLEEQLAETGHDPWAVAETLAADATPADWEQRFEVLQQRIQRLGAINLAAIDEFAGEQEREAYLQGQHNDLSQALGTLQMAMARIDRETRGRFRATFDEVNQRFTALFPRLFGGGEARLEQTEDDLLATGVRVMARPPGKRNASIQLLSGGEKALTAVALLFALFELNPAPFCMLDEIDAPLDDANVARFCALVAQMAERVQFIVITHNKLTMEMVQRLHGVTMVEPGVSRLVSVDIDQALEMAS